ncbi:extensin family protein [Luteibacter sp. NPDC031894]|uniref:extensin-like domain-containing protein n=1 Tax=Luteibacter sp. NPDC031894 TaxID=3390572 RepID=UPI003D03D4EB
MRPFLLLILLLALAALVWTRGWRPPDRYNPWAPLDLKAEPDMFLRFKLARLGDDPAQCRAAIKDAGAVFTPVADREEPNGCGWTDAVRLSAIGPARLASPVTLTCPLAASLVLFHRHVLEPAAESSFGTPVRVVDHVGSYACRNVYHRDQAPLSRHAQADAIDVTGWRLADGRRVTVAKGWSAPGEAGFLHALQADGCRYFGAFLGPDYNAAHRTHFHLQGRGFGFCR